MTMIITLTSETVKMKWNRDKIWSNVQIKFKLETLGSKDAETATGMPHKPINKLNEAKVKQSQTNLSRKTDESRSSSTSERYRIYPGHVYIRWHHDSYGDSTGSPLVC